LDVRAARACVNGAGSLETVVAYSVARTYVVFLFDDTGRSDKLGSLPGMVGSGIGDLFLLQL
jgi:hypothetical protein